MSAASRIGGVAIFAVAMGWLEAVIVVYLRAIVGLEHGQGMPPWPTIMAMLRAHDWLLPVEQGREWATMIMLLAVGWLAADRWRGRIGGYLLAFGIWDVAYYGALRILVGWPRSLAEMDLLFLLPPSPWWYQPVWLPFSIACVMAIVGALLLSSSPSATSPGTPVRRAG